MTQASLADNAEETVSLRSPLASLYPQLLYMALHLQGKKPYLANNGKEQSKEAREAGQALMRLQRGLTGDRELAGAAYFSKPEFLSAYLLYYWPVSFLQTSLAIEELRSRGVLPRLGSILDLGAGPGPAAAAAAHFGAERLLLLDKSQEALGQAERLLRAMASMEMAKRKKVPVYSTGIADLENWKNLPEGPFDLIIACHSANELWKQDDLALEKRAGLFGQAAERLSEGGVLLVIEPSALVTSRPALALRDRLLRDFAGGLYCAAPCPDSTPCPMLAAGEGRSCHSTWVWKPYEPVAALAAAAGLDRDSVKATWFALKKGSMIARAKNPLKAPALPGGAIGGGNLSGRVVSEPMLNKAGRLRYILCTTAGLATLSAKKESGSGETGGFFGLRRGDMIEASQLEIREGESNFGLVKDSGLRTIFKAPDA
jgi:SAM-dependent methyltransferase